MATYVNDLRLKEIGTGESSGTWGTETNTNLELIGEALGYATEGITTNADTHSTTVADGSTDPGRAMYIKYTGTLDSACTITIGPNTMSRVHIIENATSGSQNIIIKQGSGSEITIPNGFVKAVYLDGAGSGAAVTEAFDNLSVGTNFRIGNAAAEDTSLVFDGNAKDFYIGLDDSADKLVIGEGSTVGTNNILTITDDTVTIGDGAAADTSIVFDGNAQDYYIGLDDSDDNFIVGLGSTVGTTPVISIDTSKDITIPDSTLTITTSDNTSQLVLKSTDADANIGPVLELYRDSSSPADNDELGRIYFYGENDNDEKIEYVLFKSNIVDASDGAEGSSLQIFTYSTGGQRNRIDLLEGETVFNEGSQDIDTRIETDGDTHRVFVDAGTNRVLIGTTASRTMSGVTPDFFIEGTAYSDSSIGAVINANGQIDCPALFFGKSRGTTLGSNTVVQDGDRLFSMRIDGSDGTNLEQAAIIEVFVDGTVGNNTIPGQFRFMTTTVGDQYATEKVRIDNDGKTGIGVTDPGGLPLHIKVASGDCKLRMETAAKDAFVMELDNSTGALKLGSAATAGAIVIEQDGQVGIGTSLPGGRFMIEADGSAEDILVINNTRSGSNSTAIQQFKREGTNTGFIANTSSATSYATSQSDRRAKKNFEDWTDSVLSHFKDLKPTKFHFTQEDDSSEKNKGYIAQDLVSSFPEAYPLKDSGEDAGRYFFNPGGMVVYLMKAIQEQQVLIETLQTEVSALKGA